MAECARPRIFVTQPVAESALERLRKVASVKVNPDDSRIIPKRALIAAVRRCDILFCLLHDKIDRAVIAANPKLAQIAAQSISPSNIDVAAATARRIPVTVVPPVTTEATADLNFGLMLAVARRMVEGDRLVRAGKFPGGAVAPSARLVRLGQDHRPDRRRRADRQGGGAARARLSACACSTGRRAASPKPRSARPASPTCRSTSCCANPISSRCIRRSMRETRHQIGARELRPDEEDRVPHQHRARRRSSTRRRWSARSRRKKIAGAGLDVFEHEPKVDAALRQMTNVVLTPHLGSATVEVREEMANIVVDNILALLDGQRPPNIVNPEVLPCPAPSSPSPTACFRRSIRPRRRWRASIPSSACRRAPAPTTFSRSRAMPTRSSSPTPSCRASCCAQLTRCKAIGRFGLGVDNIDVPAATARGITVTYVPDYCMQEVSDHAMALLLALARKVPFSNTLVQSGRWEMPAVVPLRRLEGQVLGLIGFGNIPRAVAPKAQGVRAQGDHARSVRVEGVLRRAGVEGVSFDDLLARSDFISVHAPLMPATRGLVNAAASPR